MLRQLRRSTPGVLDRLLPQVKNGSICGEKGDTGRLQLAALRLQCSSILVPVQKCQSESLGVSWIYPQQTNKPKGPKPTLATLIKPLLPPTKMCGSALDMASIIECPAARPMPAGAAGQAIAVADHDAWRVMKVKKDNTRSQKSASP